MKKRLFVAIDLPQTFKKTFFISLKSFKTKDVRMTSLENLHLTVYFLGYFEEKVIPEVSKRLENVFSKTKLFSIKFDKIIFAPPRLPFRLSRSEANGEAGPPRPGEAGPSNQTPRMIWAVFQSQGFQRLVKIIGKEMDDLLNKRYKLKDRPVIPHATLARFSTFRNLKGMELKQPKTNSHLTGGNKEFVVNNCQLMESKLSRMGPKYFLIKTFNLDALR